MFLNSDAAGAGSAEPEAFPPPSLQAPRSIRGWLVFGLRVILDGRVGSIWMLARQCLPVWSGMVLDVGCGDGPWKWLLGDKTTYVGLDVPHATLAFGYSPGQTQQVIFDGAHFPLADGAFSHLLCTEVLEHVEEPRAFVRECNRVTKAGGTCFFSIPFAARYHYVPFDYWRFTPAALQKLFGEAGWEDVQVVPLGTDVSVAAHKVNTLLLKQVLGNRPRPWRLILFLLTPVACLTFLWLTAVQLLSIVFRWGSELDPLGYVVLARRR